jgi:hypothetical protein
LNLLSDGGGLHAAGALLPPVVAAFFAALPAGILFWVTPDPGAALRQPGRPQAQAPPATPR